MHDAITTQCPTCHNPLVIPAHMINAAIRCKRCGHAFHIKPRTARTSRNSNVLVARPADPNRLASFRGLAPTPNAAPPVVEAMPYVDSQDYADGGLPEIEVSGRRRAAYRGSKKSSQLFILIPLGVFILAALGGGIWLINKTLREGQTTDETDGREVVDATPAKLTGKIAATQPKSSETLEHTQKSNVPAGNTKEPWPRRLLMISINDYFYVNPLLPGASNASESEGERRDVYGIASRMQGRWMIPKDQIYILSDGPTMDKKIVGSYRLPMKQIVEQSIDQFLATAGEYDRNIILFSGHAIEKEGKAYLVPLDAELDQVDGMIPLDWFYDKLDKCKSKDNLVIFDVCRYDLSRGFERPAFGVMTDKLEETLHHAPPGVGVWTSCSKDEYSLEFNFAKPLTPELSRVCDQGEPLSQHDLRCGSGGQDG